MPLPTGKSGFVRTTRHASYNFGQEGQSLYRNQPRLPFEYYINFNLNQVGTAKSYISQYFNAADLMQIAPLVKSIEMPSIKIETTALNQYNRKRLSQTSLKFDPIKVVFHDVADGKTLKFWDMYYRYYFSDGNEPGQNTGYRVPVSSNEAAYENFLPRATKTSKLTTTQRMMQSKSSPANLPTNENGDKSAIQNIIADKLDNHNFGFNIGTVQNIRNLIQSVEIFQVHAGRFNKVTLVNPRISSFSHDVLNYAVGDRTLEITFMLEYEYAYYTVQNMQLGGGQVNNGSSLNQYKHGDYLELPKLAFNAQSVQFIESNNPQIVEPGNIGLGKNVQLPTSSVFGVDALGDLAKRVSTSSLDGLINLFPRPYTGNNVKQIFSRSFESNATSHLNKIFLDKNNTGDNIPAKILNSLPGVNRYRSGTSTLLNSYLDVNRIGKLL